MKIGVMLRDIGNQLDAPGIIVSNLVDGIVSRDNRNSYVLFFWGGAFIDRYAKYGTVKCVKVNAPNKLLWDQVAAPWAAWREGVDVLFHPKHSVPLLAMCPTIMHLRGDEYWEFPEHFEWTDLAYQKLFLPLFCRKAQRLIAESDSVMNGFQKNVRSVSGKMVRIHLAAAEMFSRGQKGRGSVAEQYDLPDRYVLTVTRVLQGKKFYPGKNIYNAIEGFLRSRARLDGYKFVIVGRGVEAFMRRYKEGRRHEGAIESIVALDSVPQSDLPEIYANSDLFLFPSIYESFGIPILEAMSSGCPVVTSKNYSCPEIAGDAAILVDPGDSAEIADAIDRVLFDEELRQHLVQRARQRAAEFSWQRAARETIDLFNEVEESVVKPRKSPVLLHR